MKKRFLLLLLPLVSFCFVGKNPVKTDSFDVKQVSFAYEPAPHDAATFISYWEDDFRKNNPSVCDIPKPAYKEMYSFYWPLEASEKEIVDATKDVREPDYTIKQIILTLVNKYEPSQSKMKANKQKLDQSAIIIIATVVALVGASAISVLYILKNNKVIK